MTHPTNWLKVHQKTLRNVTYPSVHEDEVHLAEGEDHLQDGVDAPEHLVAGGVPRDLEEGPQLQPVVDHGAKTEGWNGWW